MDLKTARARVAELEAKVASYQKSEPPAGQPSGGKAPAAEEDVAALLASKYST